MSVLAPVPPLAGNNVPLNTISPPVGEPGDNPVDPALNEDTPPKAIEFQEPPAYPSKNPVSELNLSSPLAPTGLCPDVPIGTVTEPEPGNIGLLAIEIVGSPLAPVPLVTVI